MMARRGIETLRRLADDLSTAGSLCRSACWTVVFFVLILCVASPPREPGASPVPRSGHPVPVDGFLRVTPDRYELLYDRLSAPDAFRIAVIGSSEAFDFHNHHYSLGASLLRLAPRFTSAKVEVIERTQPMLSRREKMEAVRQAVALDADLIVVSIPLIQLYSPVRSGELDDPCSVPVVDVLLAAAQTPSGSLDRLLSAVWPGYQANLARAFHLAPPIAHRAASGAIPNGDTVSFIRKPAPPRTSTESKPPLDLDATVQDGIPRDARNNNIVRRTYIENGHIRPDALVTVFKKLAEPAVDDGVPVVLIASPVDETVLDEKDAALVQDDAKMVNAASAQLTGLSVILFNGLQLNRSEAGEFQDLIHLVNHDPLASALLKNLVDREVIPTSESTDKN